MSCYGDDGYYRLGGCYGYGVPYGYGPGFGSIHNGFRSQSCCGSGIGAVGPYWGAGPCGQAGGVYGCGYPAYNARPVVYNIGCGTAVGFTPRGGSFAPCANRFY